MHYMPVLQLALKFAFGNRALRNSPYKVFKYSKKSEAEAAVNSIVHSFKRIEGSGSLTNYQLVENKKRNNILLSLLNQKIVFRVWKEYLLISDKFAAREGGIVSDRELHMLISKQRIEEMKYYNKQNCTLSQKDVPIRHMSMQMIESFSNIHRQLQDSRL